jgi:hypothetical protein
MEYYILDFYDARAIGDGLGRQARMGGQELACYFKGTNHPSEAWLGSVTAFLGRVQSRRAAVPVELGRRAS